MYLLRKQEDSRDIFNYPELEKRYNIVSTLHLHLLDHKENVVQEFYLKKIASHKILGKIQVGFLQKIEEINQGKANNILFPDKNVHIKELGTK